ncbi:hypothetical protein LSM04_008835 [Trypanosoma melophagium]|uniref:uncharacterized protein n=1 Tax=Trypanosoma melophagium TaxID=715481 RepID=UPI00351A5F27|nr:hypothetical protein LSM04_008835 [Trypanosoma melophagium]
MVPNDTSSTTGGGNTNSDGNTPAKGSSFNWRRILLGATVAAVIAAAWCSVYRANQRELHARRKEQRDKLLLAALGEVPGRRFSVTDVNPEVLRKNALLE